MLRNLGFTCSGMLASHEPEYPYWVCGAVMIGVAGTITLVLRSDVASPELYVGGEALANAVILWSTAAWGIRTARATQRFT
jgi:hypothetical protein